MSEYPNIENRNGFSNRWVHRLAVVAAAFLVILGIVKFVEYLVNEVTMGQMMLSQAIIIFVFEAVAVGMISRALRKFVENRTGKEEEKM